MPKFDNASLEAAALERDAHRHESHLARLGGRCKFTGCRRCGGFDGMRSVSREALAETPPSMPNWTKSPKLWWYREPGNSERLFYPCPECNPGRDIPEGLVSLHNIQSWLDRDPMSPDHAALGRDWRDEMEQTVDFPMKAAYARGWRPETRNRPTGGIEYDVKINEYIATAITGAEVYGATRQECYDNLREANRAWIAHCQKCEEDRDGI